MQTNVIKALFWLLIVLSHEKFIEGSDKKVRLSIALN